MKKFIITSEGFAGEVHIVYNNSVLMLLDLSQAELNPEQVHYFKEKSPTMYFPDSFGQHFSSKLTIVEASFEVTFEMFWAKYAHKINRDRCVKLWDKMSITDRIKAYFGITPYFAYLGRTGFRNKKDPENYLRNKMWLTDWSKAK